MQLTAELEAQIVERLKTGEKAIHVARALEPVGVLTWQVYATAFIHDIKLKSGPVAKPHDPARYAKRFDRRYGAGTASRLLKLAKTIGLRKIAKVFGRSWQWAHERYYKLGGKKEELAWNNPAMRKNLIRLVRPDITAQLVRRLAKRCHSQKEMARRLRCSEETILHRARENNIQLPKGHVRWDLTPAKIRRAAKNCRSVTVMMGKLHASRIAILRRAKRSGIPLPDGRWGYRPGTIAILKRLRHYLRLRYPVRKIAKLIKKNRRTIHGYLRKYPEYFAGIPGQRRGQRQIPTAA